MQGAEDVKKEAYMPRLKEIDINYDQIRELVCQLEFKKKMSLIKEIVKEKDYRNSFYAYMVKIRFGLQIHCMMKKILACPGTKKESFMQAVTVN